VFVGKIKMNKKIVYVTGCLGFIGYHVTLACLEKGYMVRGIDKGTYAANWNLLPELEKWDSFVFEEKDINDIDRLYDCDYIINTAAETHVDNSIESSDEFVHSNINGVHHLLKLINNKKGRRPVFLHFSTDEVYGDIEYGSHKESDVLKPSNPYSATKAAADMLVLAWGRTYNLPYIIVRPTNNYGIGQYVEKLIPKTCKFMQVGRKVDLHNKGTPIRTWLHAKDTAQAIIAIINAGVVNEIYNISGNYETQNIVVVNKILKHFGLDNSEGHIEDLTRIGQDVRYSIDDTKLRKLGWLATADFDTELALIVQYYKDNFIW
jgi:dTDP-glucose 4,6-dehydratase